MGEHLVPLQRESWGFWDRQKEVFGDMFKGMDDEWGVFDQEIEKMKKEMFTLKPLDFGDLTSFGKGFDDFGDFGKSLIGSDSGQSLSSSTTSKITSSTKITSTSSTTTKSSGSSSTTSSSSSSVTKSSSTGTGNVAGSLDTGSLASIGSSDASIGSSNALIGSSNANALSMMIQPERPIISDAEGNKRLSLRFDCKQFKPEEITVKTINNKLMVHAKHVEESPGKKVYREFTRQYILPEKIDPMALNSVLAADGVLTIEAPAPAAIEAPRERLLPIKRL